MQFALSPDSPVTPHLVVFASPFVWALFVRFMFLSETPEALLKSMPFPVLFEIVPPVPGVVLMPVTVRPPLSPLVFSTMPGLALAVDALMLWNVRSQAPMVVLATLSAVPVVVVSVLVVAVAVTVAPVLLVAVNAGLAPVLRESAPLNAIVPPVLLSRNTPVPVSVMGPDRVSVPELR